MAYTALARKYRSRTFDEVVGQGPIAATLSNAIKSGRVHHGFLFTGTRGVGKTSMARILAKALNCLKHDAATVSPCLECDSCVAVAEGQDIDVVEIDAASNTGVDNIRELRSNAAFRPARARFKIYIIDEVHMLSTGAFNALLKTLEEPPSHVKFILATTEVQKVPATIRSRCQCYNFRNISAADIATALAQIAQRESAKADDAAVRRIARLANGSMRDALSILDQLLSLSPDRVTEALLNEVLPPPQDEQTRELFESAARGDVAGALAALERVLGSGRGLEVFCNDAIEQARTLMSIRACGIDAAPVDVPADQRDAYAALAQRFELSQCVQAIGMFEELRRNVRYSATGRALADAVVVRLANMRSWTPIEDLLRGGASSTPSAGVVAEKKKTLSELAPPPRGAGDVAAFRPSPPAPRIDAEPGFSARRVAVVDAVDRRVAAEPAPAMMNTIAVDAKLGADRTGEASEVDAPRAPASPRAESPPAAGRSSSLVPAGAEVRERVMKDAVVRQALELFDAIVVNIEREAGRATAPPADEAESD